MKSSAAAKTVPSDPSKTKPSASHKGRLALRLLPTGLEVPKKAPKKERFLNVQITDKEIALLYQLIEYDGIANIAKAIGVCDVTILRVCAGMFHRCRPGSQHAVRRFFAETIT